MYWDNTTDRHGGAVPRRGYRIEEQPTEQDHLLGGPYHHCRLEDEVGMLGWSLFYCICGIIAMYVVSMRRYYILRSNNTCIKLFLIYYNIFVLVL